MKLSVAAALVAMLLLSVVACASHSEPESDPQAAPPESTLIGQVLLPSGLGSRGVEVQVLISSVGNEPRRVWVLFDEQGHFTHTFMGRLTRVEVTAGAEVHRIGSEDLPEADPQGQIDVGVIDLRDRLATHHLMLRAAGGKPQGDVRVGMWIGGPPPVGPSGESVSLGSRQFPPVALGSEMEWLLPHAADSIYFLVERPADARRGTEWRSGHQRLFGPFTSERLPAELIMD